MIWEGAPAPGVMERLTTLGVTSIVFDPCGTPPEAGDYLDVMSGNAEALGAALDP